MAPGELAVRLQRLSQTQKEKEQQIEELKRQETQVEAQDVLSKKIAIINEQDNGSYMFQNTQFSPHLTLSYVSKEKLPIHKVKGKFPGLIEELQQMAERKKVGDRTIRISKINSIGDFKKGHVLFIPSGQSSQLADVLTKLADKSTLVITEQPGLGAKGSDVNFVLKEGKLAFELNQNALSKHKLKAANELTRLAIII